MRSAILSEKPYRPARWRRRRRRWLLTLASVPSLGVVAAFGIAPDTSTEHIERREVTQAVPLVVADAPEPGEGETYWREEAILRGDTVASLLARLQVDDPEALAYLHATPGARPLYRLTPGRNLRAVTTGDGRLVWLRYPKTDSTELVVRREGEGFALAEEQLATESQLVMASGVVETSLFAATDRAGLNETVAIQLADIFSSEIDFQRDLQPGDRFAVIYEALFAGGEFLRPGRILAAEFINANRSYRAVYFQDPQGRGAYYTPEGRNLRKASCVRPRVLTHHLGIHHRPPAPGARSGVRIGVSTMGPRWAPGFAQPRMESWNSRGNAGATEESSCCATRTVIRRCMRTCPPLPPACARGSG
jgi:hypothetical protein